MSQESRDESKPEAEGDRGVPGEGKGRKDVVEPSGVYPASAGEAPSDAEIRAMGEWGHGTYEADEALPRRMNREEAPGAKSDIGDNRE